MAEVILSEQQAVSSSLLLQPDTPRLSRPQDEVPGETVPEVSRGSNVLRSGGETCKVARGRPVLLLFLTSHATLALEPVIP